MAEPSETAVTTPATNLPIIRSPFYRLTYSNAFRIKMTANDATIVFMIQTDAPGLPTEVMQDEVAVALTLPALKILWQNLNTVLPKMEEYFGAIRVPETAILTDEKIAPMIAAL